MAKGDLEQRKKKKSKKKEKKKHPYKKGGRYRASGVSEGASKK